MRRTDAGKQLNHPERGDRVARILRPAQHAHQILHMRRLEKLESAVFHERDVAPAELDLEQVGVMRSAHQHRLSRSEEHTSELQSLRHLVCRLQLEKRKRAWWERHTVMVRLELQAHGCGDLCNRRRLSSGREERGSAQLRERDSKSQTSGHLRGLVE